MNVERLVRAETKHYAYVIQKTSRQFLEEKKNQRRDNLRRVLIKLVVLRTTDSPENVSEVPRKEFCACEGMLYVEPAFRARTNFRQSPPFYLISTGQKAWSRAEAPRFHASL